MSAETTARYIARYVASWPHLDAWHKDRELASLRRDALLYRCEACKAVLKALGEPEMEDWLGEVMGGRVAPAPRTQAAA